MRSGLIYAGYFLPESEWLIAHFERQLVAALGADIRSRGASGGHACRRDERRIVFEQMPTRTVTADSRLLNRELSWVEFNARVLDLAAEERSRCSSG